MKTIPLRYGSQNTEIQISVQSPSAYTAGDNARMKITVDDKLVRDYADQYGDRNPIHLDDAAGAASIFKSRVAHGMLTFNFFSTILGAGFPGPGTIFKGVNEWRFTAPVKIGDQLIIQVKVLSARQKSNGTYDLQIEGSAATEAGTQVMSGSLGVIAPKPE